MKKNIPTCFFHEKWSNIEKKKVLLSEKFEKVVFTSPYTSQLLVQVATLIQFTLYSQFSAHIISPFYLISN